jgi:hypothetical protein
MEVVITICGNDTVGVKDEWFISFFGHVAFSIGLVSTCKRFALASEGMRVGIKEVVR